MNLDYKQFNDFKNLVQLLSHFGIECHVRLLRISTSSYVPGYVVTISDKQ
jgi:hypothetical protein